MPSENVVLEVDFGANFELAKKRKNAIKKFFELLPNDSVLTSKLGLNFINWQMYAFGQTNFPALSQSLMKYIIAMINDIQENYHSNNHEFNKFLKNAKKDFWQDLRIVIAEIVRNYDEDFMMYVFKRRIYKLKDDGESDTHIAAANSLRTEIEKNIDGKDRLNAFKEQFAKVEQYALEKDNSLFFNSTTVKVMITMLVVYSGSNFVISLMQEDKESTIHSTIGISLATLIFVAIVGYDYVYKKTLDNKCKEILQFKLVDSGLKLKLQRNANNNQRKKEFEEYVKPKKALVEEIKINETDIQEENLETIVKSAQKQKGKARVNQTSNDDEFFLPKKKKLKDEKVKADIDLNTITWTLKTPNGDVVIKGDDKNIVQVFQRSKVESYTFKESAKYKALVYFPPNTLANQSFFKDFPDNDDKHYFARQTEGYSGFLCMSEEELKQYKIKMNVDTSIKYKQMPEVIKETKVDPKTYESVTTKIEIPALRYLPRITLFPNKKDGVIYEEKHNLIVMQNEPTDRKKL